MRSHLNFWGCSGLSRISPTGQRNAPVYTYGGGFVPDICAAIHPFSAGGDVLRVL